MIRQFLTKYGFKVDTGKLVATEKRVDQVNRRMAYGARQARQLGADMSRAFTAIKTAVMGIVIHRFGRAFTTEYSTAADKTLKFADGVGIATDALQGLHHAAELNNVSQEQLHKAIAVSAKRARDATLGLKTQKEAFQELGVVVTDNSGKLRAQDEIFMDIIEGLRKMGPGTRRTALAQELLGRGSATMLPLIDAGREGIEKMRKEAERLGIVLSRKALEDARDFNDALTRVKASFRGLRNSIAKELLPHITALAKRFTDWYKTGNNAQRLLHWLKLAATAAGVAIASMIAAKVKARMVSFVGWARKAIHAIRAMGLAGLWSSIKIGALIAVLAAIGLLIEDLYVFATGGKSLIGEALGGTEEGAMLKAALLEFGSALKELWATLKPALIELWKVLKPLLAKVWSVVKSLVPFLTDILVGIIHAITVVLTVVVNAITWVINAAKDAWATIKEGWNVAGAAIQVGIGVIVGAWNKVKAVGLAVWNAIGNAATKLAHGIRDVWVGITTPIKRAWQTIVDWIQGVLDTIDTAIRTLQALVGKGGKLATSGMSSAVDAVTKATKRTSVTSSKSVSVGAVSVNVAGTTNMSSTQMQAAVKSGTRDALNDIILENMADYAGAT